MIAGKLLPSQKHIGHACKEFLRALTNHAIDDLVDLATGFEDIRKRRAIDKIIERFVEKAAQPWVKMFDLDFYQHIFQIGRAPDCTTFTNAKLVCLLPHEKKNL